MGFFPSVAWYQHRCLLEEGTDERNYNSQSQSAIPTCDLHSPHHCCTADGFVQLLQKRLVARPDKKRHTFLKTQRFTAIFIRGRNLKLTGSSWTPSTCQNLDLSMSQWQNTATASCIQSIITHYTSPELFISKAHSLIQFYPIHTPSQNGSCSVALPQPAVSSQLSHTITAQNSPFRSALSQPADPNPYPHTLQTVQKCTRSAAYCRSQLHPVHYHTL
jgi:hypothetical protein